MSLERLQERIAAAIERKKTEEAANKQIKNPVVPMLLV